MREEVIKIAETLQRNEGLYQFMKEVAGMDSDVISNLTTIMQGLNRGSWTTEIIEQAKNSLKYTRIALLVSVAANIVLALVAFFK